MLSEEIINELPHDFGLAIRTNASNHHRAYHIMDVFRHPGLCLTLQKTSWNLRSMLNKNNIDSRQLHIIDPLSKVIGSLLEDGNTTHVPYNLKHIMTAVEAGLQKFPLKERFVIVDSFHTLPHFYGEEKAISFLKMLNNKLKINHAKTVYLYEDEKLSDNVREALQNVVDKVIEMN